LALYKDSLMIQSPAQQQQKSLIDVMYMF
jgi:hypothetical protein